MFVLLQIFIMRKSQASQRLSQPTQHINLSQGTPRSQHPPIATNELKEAARAAVRYLLMNDFDKVPIKHTEIVKNVTRNLSRNTSQVLELASKMLLEVNSISIIIFYSLVIHYLIFLFYSSNTDLWN